MIDCWGYCFVNPAPWPVGKNLNKKYDAWGRLRNPSNHSLYTPTNEPEPFLGRGYCSHEHLTGLGLINMNARLYDPLLGRFLSPDNFVQLPDFSQSFNRYSYCLNNPLKYTDPSGEWAIIDDLIAMFVGGTINVISNAIEGNISSLEHGLWLFGSGALAGETALYSGSAAPFVSAGILGFGNSCINQYYNNGSINWDQVVLDVGMSEMMASFTSVVGGILPPIGDKISSNIKSPLLHDITKNTIDSSIGGASLGFLFGWAEEDADIGDALKSSAEGLGFGIVNGIVSGTGSGFSRVFHEHINPWTGRHMSKELIQKCSRHMNAHNRNDNIGIETEKMNKEVADMIEKNYKLLHNGDNTFRVKVNNIEKVLRVHLNNGIITSYDFMNWNGRSLRSATPVIKLPDQWWK